IHTVASETNVTHEHAEAIIQKAAQAVANSTRYQEQITQITNTPVQTIQQIAQSITHVTRQTENAPVADTIISETSSILNLTEEDVTSVIQSFASNENLVKQVSESTQIDAKSVQNAFASYTTHLTEAPTQLVKSVAQETNLTQDQVQNIMQSSYQIINNAPD